MGFFSRLFGKKKDKQEANQQNKPDKLKIAIVIGSVRDGRNAKAVAEWTLDFATSRNDNADYELVDLADYRLPMLGESLTEEKQAAAERAVSAWSDKMSTFDAYIFVVPEYNHTVGGALKNALDFVNKEVNNKVAGFVGYGSLGGTRAHENMRLILGELQVADVRTAVTFSLMTDFENMSEFEPADYHKNNANEMLDQVHSWGKAFKTLR
jgi:NAD(P)H-dependent FMN reductase